MPILPIATEKKPRSPMAPFGFAQNLPRRRTDTIHILEAHPGKQRQSHGLAADPLGIGKLTFAIAELAISGEQMQSGIMHAYADAAIMHRLDESAAGNL